MKFNNRAPLAEELTHMGILPEALHDQASSGTSLG